MDDDPELATKWLAAIEITLCVIALLLVILIVRT